MSNQWERVGRKHPLQHGLARLLAYAQDPQHRHSRAWVPAIHTIVSRLDGDKDTWHACVECALRWWLCRCAEMCR
jgi:hypothetical protein